MRTGFPGDSATDLQHDMRAVWEGDSQADSCGDSHSDVPADSCRDSKADLRRGLQRGLPRDFDGDFDGVLRAAEEGRRKRNPPQIRQDAERPPTRGICVCPLRVRSSDFLHLASDISLRPQTRPLLGVGVTGGNGFRGSGVPGFWRTEICVHLRSSVVVLFPSAVVDRARGRTIILRAE